MDYNLILDSFNFLLDPTTVLMLVFGTFFGILVGALPGLGTVTALAMLLPFTYVLTGPQAISLLLSVYVSSIFGGSIPALLINVPGTPQSAATTFDGYPMAQKGQAPEALGWVTICSVIGGIISMLILMFSAPQLAKFALKFGSVETFALIIFSLLTIAWVSDGSPVKGILAGLIGVFTATIGIDNMSGIERYTFGEFELSAGLNVTPILIGLFALSEVFYQINNPSATPKKIDANTGFKFPDLNSLKIRYKTIIKSSLIGTFLGILPGVGATAASMIAYANAKSSSPRALEFGKGEPEGIAASEAANNAVSGGALLPTLALGIPGDAATAVMLGALIIHGITPGAQLFQSTPELVNYIFIALLLSNILILFASIISSSIFSKILKIDIKIILSVVFALSISGSYIVRFNFLDVYVAIFTGFIGVILRYCKVPLAPIVIGFILGPSLENSLRKGLILNDMNFIGFFQSPIALVIFSITFIVLVYPFIKALLKYHNKWRNKRGVNL